jgi:hypothetical protein
MPAPKEPTILNGCSPARETTMNRFLKNVLAILKKTNEPKSVGRAERPSPTPGLAVRSQVKAGSFNLAANNKV